MQTPIVTIQIKFIHATFGMFYSLDIADHSGGFHLFERRLQIGIEQGASDGHVVAVEWIL